ncbi:MAG: serine hydrolase [Eudoraea sp.]|uniref:serine hydrolase n=1 Tax=Eudoraea sp. TaxID=1979955 RepID=UPI0032651AD1
MKIKTLFFIVICAGMLSKSYAQNIRLDSLDFFIDTLMDDFEVTGLSIGIVQNDSIIYSKGFGLTEIGKTQKVDNQTLFGIGSISKSFTALTLGILVDEGKITWDDRVKDYLPYFELYDPYVTENFTIRDLLTHRSGLKDVSGGTLWYHSDYSRVEIIKRLKYLEPVSGFREKPAYQNVMFVVASEIVKEVSGMPWDDFLKSRVFNKLAMNNSTSLSKDREATSNLAQPHIWNAAYKKVAIKQENGDNLGPGGFIYSSAKDMNSYMRLLLNDGVFKNDTIVSKDVVDELFKPQTLFQNSGPPFGNEFSSYGFGWWLTPWNGHKIIEHSGGIDGMSAQLFMVKDLDIGVVILTNVSKEPASFLLKAKLLELIFNDKSFDFYDRGIEYRKGLIKKLKKAAANEVRPKESYPSLALSNYAGSYNDKMYGDINISLSNNKLELSFSHTPLFKGRLIHWQFDTFKIDWYDIRVPDGFLTFNFNSQHEVTGLKLDQEDLLDVDFEELEIIRIKN